MIRAKSTTALLILNPRHIPYCIQALQNLNIPKCWITSMGERNAAQAINQAIQQTSYTQYAVVADDCQPTQAALDAILNLANAGHPIVTGYCNLDNILPDVNLCQNHLPPPPPTVDSYEFLTQADIDKYPDDQPIPTTFAGLALTLMSRDLWLTHPVHAEHGCHMDYHLSWELQNAGHQIVAPKHGFVQHHKDRWCYPDTSPEKQLLIGVRNASVTWTDT